MDTSPVLLSTPLGTQLSGGLPVLVTQPSLRELSTLSFRILTTLPLVPLTLAAAQLSAKLIWQMSPCCEIHRAPGLIYLVDRTLSAGSGDTLVQPQAPGPSCCPLRSCLLCPEVMLGLPVYAGGLVALTMDLAHIYYFLIFIYLPF